MRTRAGRFVRRHWWKASLGASAAGCALWWLHALLDHFFPPNETAFDALLHVVVSLCKIVTLASVPFVLRLVGACLYRDRRLARRYALAGLAGLGILLLLLTALRDPVAEVLSNEAVRFYYVSDASPLSRWHYLGRGEWLARWRSGQIALIEASLGLLAISLICGLSYAAGNRRRTAAALTVLLGVLVGAWPNLFRLGASDHDFYLGGVYSDSLALDCLWPLAAADPVSQIALSVWFAFIAGSLAGVWPKLRRPQAVPGGDVDVPGAVVPTDPAGRPKPGGAGGATVRGRRGRALAERLAKTN